MYVEERVYRLRPGASGEYFALYESRGMPVQLRYLNVMLGYYMSEIGDLNEVIHMWVHESLDGREANRERMRADPEFQAYWQAVRPLIVSQRTRIMKPAPFFGNTLKNIVEIAKARDA